jgi:hypothetical protein
VRPRASSYQSLERSRPSLACAVPVGAGSVPSTPSRLGGRRRFARGRTSEFSLDGWIVSVADNFFVVAGSAGDIDDDLNVEVPIDVVAPSQRHLVQEGTNVKWRVSRHRRDEERILTESSLRLRRPEPLPVLELRAAARHAEAFKEMLGRFPERDDETV